MRIFVLIILPGQVTRMIRIVLQLSNSELEVVVLCRPRRDLKLLKDIDILVNYGIVVAMVPNCQGRNLVYNGSGVQHSTASVGSS